MTTVKHFHSAMSGAPVLSGAAGTLLAVLDACLVTGFGLKAADGITVSGGVATITFSSAHAFEQDAIMQVDGATPAGLNGEKRIISSTTYTASFAAPGVADGAATGTISAKLAPAGWEKAFSGTNVAAYRSLDVTGTRMYLRVDDTGTTNARVVGYEAMTDVNTGTGPFPSPAQISGGGWWPKAADSSATARAWTLVADSRGFYLHIHTATSSPGASGCVWIFGDFASLKSGDAYSAGLQCASADVSTAASSVQDAAEHCSSGVTGLYLARSFTALGGSVSARHSLPDVGSDSKPSGSSGGLQAPAYPNGPDNGLILGEKLILEPGVCRRGHAPGLFVTPQGCHGQFSWRDKIDGQGELAGRKLLAVKCGSPAGTSSQGVVFFDITGPWSR